MIKKLQALKKKKGFTLVELIVVIAIIGVLAAILVPTMLGYVSSSRVTSANSTATELKNSINNWITDMDTKGYSIAKNAGASGAAQDEWKITFTSGAANAFTADPSIWSTAGQALGGPTGATNSNIYGYLEQQLESDYTFNNVAITAFINEGKCVAVVYYADGSSMVSDAPTYANFSDPATNAYAWSNTDGITATSGAILGTSPQLTTSLS